jgi:hypothetical protein
MKPPAALDPEFTAEDWASVEQIETYVERCFQKDPNKSSMNLVTEGDRRHLNEFAKRARAAGWLITARYSHLLIERPPLGEIDSTVRLSRGQPAANLTALVQLIGPTPVEAILDVYLDDVALERLVTMHRLGVNFSPKTRLLTSKSKKGADRLSKQFVQDLFKDLGCNQGAVKSMPANQHEGRFILLSGANVVTLGCSLNNLDVNETTHRGGDHGEREYFEGQWSTAESL